MSETKHLFGTEGAEELYDEIATVFESEIEPNLLDDNLGEILIEEWSTYPVTHHLPRAERIVEWILDWAMDNGEVNEQWMFPISDPDILAAAEKLREQIGEKTPYLMADQKVGEHKITGTADAPLLNGEPMYVKRQE
jgi:hypothetical protein